MVLVWLKGKTEVEVSLAYDVIHKPDGICCIDDLGAVVASFSLEEVLAYSAHPSGADRPQARDSRSRTGVIHSQP